jgi:sulfite exporter TauE/SafE
MINNILLAFIAGLTTGGLSCLAVQGGLLASSVAAEVEQSVAQQQPAPARRSKTSVGTHPPLRASRPILLFLGAKLVAYTLLGFVLGLVGSVLQLTPITRAILQIGIGIFMVGTALRMLNVHPIFRYFALQPPYAVTSFIRRKSKGDASALTPLFLGALTSPVFFAVAYLATSLGSRLEKSFMRIVAVVVLVLGLVAIDSGLTLAGWPYSVTNVRLAMAARADASVTAQPAASLPAARNTSPQEPSSSAGSGGLTDAPVPAFSNSNIVTITVANSGYSPAVVRAKPGQPFKLAMVTNDTYSCARALVVPALGVRKELPATGTVMIDVPAQPAGSKLFYSCSMGMYSGVIVFDG